VGELILAVVVGAILFAAIKRGSKNNRLAKKLDACVAGMQKALEAGDFKRFAELDAAAENIDREAVYDVDRWGHVRNGDPYSCAKDSLARIRKDYMAMSEQKQMPPYVSVGAATFCPKCGMFMQSLSADLPWTETHGATCKDEKREFEEARESITREYKELVERFAQLFSDGSSPWDELTRTSNALNGTSKSTPFRDGVELYTARILKAFSVANGSTPNGLGRMFHILTITGREKDAHGGIPGNFIQMLNLTLKQWGELGRSPQKPWTMAKCVEESIRWIEEVDHTPPDVPRVVMALSEFDKLRKTHLAADTADAYYALVIRASECCSASMAVDALRAKYLTLLQPYISADSFKNGSQSSSGNRNDNESCIQFNGNCPKCVKYFPVLRLKPDAGEKETKEAYRNFVKIYHPDRFEGKSERQTAEEELKQVNEAYRHILEHFEAAASKAASAGVTQ